MKGFGATMKSHKQFHSVPFFSIKFIRGLTVFTKRKIFTQKKKGNKILGNFSSMIFLTSHGMLHVLFSLLIEKLMFFSNTDLLSSAFATGVSSF